MSKEQMTIRLYPETRRQMDGWLEESNSKNRNEFVEKALRFYMGYLGTENITEYLSRKSYQQSPVQVRGRAGHHGAYYRCPLP